MELILCLLIGQFSSFHSPYLASCIYGENSIPVSICDISINFLGFVKAMLYVIFVLIMIKIHTFPLFAIRPMYLTLRYVCIVKLVSLDTPL